MEQILIIEDSKVAQAQLGDILAPHYGLEIHEEGKNGFTAALERPPDLVLLDIHLPRIDGYTICRMFKEEPRTREIPVIFLTSLDAEQQRVKGFEAGAEDYIVKPFYPRELLARVNLHLSSRRARVQEREFERLKVLQELAIALSHEINNPLTSLYGYLHLLEKEIGSGPGSSVNCLIQIKRELERVQRIVERLSQASKAATTGYVRESTMIDIEHI